MLVILSLMNLNEPENNLFVMILVYALGHLPTAACQIRWSQAMHLHSEVA